MVQTHLTNVLLGKHRVLVALLASSVAALAAAQGTGTLLAGQTLYQGQVLSSTDGRVSLYMQTDGNLVLYSTQVANLFGLSFASAIYATATYGASPGPFSLVMQQNCDLVLLNGNNQAIYSSGTANQGTAPCQLVVSGAGGGGFAVVDSTQATLYTQGAYSPPGTVPGTLPAYAMLTQDSKLFSWDGTVCLVAQSDGNLVLYNVALLAQYGYSNAAAAVWASATSSNGPRPYRLIMQSDCNLVMYDASGTSFNDAIYYSATYNQGAQPCTLTVSSSGGGFIAVSDSAYTALYVQPASFGVLLDAGFAAFSNGTLRQQYQIFDVNSGSAFQTTASPRLEQASSRTLLPTTNTILAYPSFGPLGAELFHPQTQTWTATGSPSTQRLEFGFVTLFDGTALAVGGGSSEIYSPATGSWTPVGGLPTQQSEAQVALLQNGNVLAAGGAPNTISYSAAAEVFNVKTRQWTVVGSMATPRLYHQMTTLLDGRVLVSGGQNTDGTPTGSLGVNASEIFNPATSTFSPAGVMRVARYLHRATLLPSGKVLVTGGFGTNPVQYPTPPCVNLTYPGYCQPYVTVNSSEIYDPATGAWTVGPYMPYIRYGHDQLLLPNGRVLIAGGFGSQDNPNGPFLTPSLVYNVTTNAFYPTGSLPRSDDNSFDRSQAVLFRM